jgi:hypothetical protein
VLFCKFNLKCFCEFIWKIFTQNLASSFSLCFSKYHFVKKKYSTLCQFYQHFMSSFFVRNFLVQIILYLKYGFVAKKSCSKALKMLVKLSTCFTQTFYACADVEIGKLRHFSNVLFRCIFVGKMRKKYFSLLKKCFFLTFTHSSIIRSLSFPTLMKFHLYIDIFFPFDEFFYHYLFFCF